ncbi:thiamine biosynthesis protein ThiF [Actinoplanes sp. N902-109]|uniref:thiamine biosynthesis protein ThiF n=1 Tax=Actinoplanes sp. (strain N902-109) TaxID=649831 RepID=UPI0005A12FF8|nr:thiamine biosynthesis protein ThiF [Actinoplanes sp. N902-109]
MSRPPLHRPLLLPGLPRIWRGRTTLQVGLHPGRAILLDLPDPATAKILDLLDGTRPERAILRAAGTLDLSPADVRALLDVLHETGLVISTQRLYPPALDAPSRALLLSEATALALAADSRQPRFAPPALILRRRRSARIVVTGRGRLGAGIAVGLAEAGIGHVQADLPGPVGLVERIGGPLREAGVGTDRKHAVAQAIGRAAPSTDTRSIRRGTATLVVQLCHDQPVALLALAYLQHRQPYLAVSVREGAAVIGPLVPPGGRPCLNCLALFRQQPPAADPAPAGSDPAGAGPSELMMSGPEPLAVATALAASGYAVAEVLKFVDGTATETIGAEIEVSAPGRIRRRRWKPHPHCVCGQSRRWPEGQKP